MNLFLLIAFALIGAALDGLLGAGLAIIFGVILFVAIDMWSTPPSRRY